jgi:hypothetical protein
VDRLGRRAFPMTSTDQFGSLDLTIQASAMLGVPSTKKGWRID